MPAILTTTELFVIGHIFGHDEVNQIYQKIVIPKFDEYCQTILKLLIKLETPQPVGRILSGFASNWKKSIQIPLYILNMS